MRITEDALATLFTDARSQNGWGEDRVDDADLRAAYEIARWGPTSMNTQPMRLLFLRSSEAKARLRPALLPANVDKAMAAPVIAIIAYDLAFISTCRSRFRTTRQHRLFSRARTHCCRKRRSATARCRARTSCSP